MFILLGVLTWVHFYCPALRNQIFSALKHRNKKLASHISLKLVPSLEGRDFTNQYEIDGPQNGKRNGGKKQNTYPLKEKRIQFY